VLQRRDVVMRRPVMTVGVVMTVVMTVVVAGGVVMVVMRPNVVVAGHRCRGRRGRDHGGGDRTEGDGGAAMTQVLGTGARVWAELV
jgi:hypothetical protein